MTFLQLCQRLVQEAAITTSSSGPSTVVSQSGELGRVVNWVIAAWKDIQNLHPNWAWMRKPFTLALAAATDTYAYSDATDTEDAAAISRFKKWWAVDENDPYRCYLTSGGASGEYWLSYIDIRDFRRLYQLGSGQSGRPIHVSVDYSLNLVFGPTPDDAYTVSGDYQRGVQVLAADADVPEIPSDYVDLIWMWALENYGYYEAATEVLQRVKAQGMRLLRNLELNQRPAPELADPMCE